MIQVFQSHALQFPFGDLEAWDPGKYQKVADVDIPDDDHADVYRLTQNIEESWIYNDKVIPATENMKFGRGFRSTSIGDIIVLSNSQMLQCVDTGWKLIGFMATNPAESDWSRHDELAAEYDYDVQLDGDWEWQ